MGIWDFFRRSDEPEATLDQQSVGQGPDGQVSASDLSMFEQQLPEQPLPAQEVSGFEGKVREVRGRMGSEVAEKVLPPERKITGVTEETFQSVTFQRAGYDQMPERYGSGDRQFTTVDTDQGKAYIVSGKVSSGNPYEVGHAADGPRSVGDQRATETVVYDWDGNKAITEYSQGQVSVHTGEAGNPDTLLYWVRQKLGTSVGVQEYRSSETEKPIDNT